MTETLLAVEGLSVRFGGVCAVDGLSFDVARGELLGLIGPNGAGKTTAMRAVTGVVRPTSGALRFRGRRLDGVPTHARARAGLAFSQQLVRPFAAMSVLDNVALAAGHAYTRTPWRALLALARARAGARAHELLRAVAIDDAAHALPASLPLGVLKRLEMARALALEPILLVLDEPLAGLNTREARRLADTIAALREGGLTVILIEHNLAEVLRVCTRLLVLDNGVKIGEGAPRAVMADARVRAAYLGGGHAAA